MDSDLIAELDQIQKPEQPPGHFDPSDELSNDDIAECIKKTDEYIEKENFKELNLEKSSEYSIPGQEWVLVSFVGEDSTQKTKELGMKVWGAFGTIEEAKEHADKINKDQDQRIFDVYILEMYCWAMIPPKQEYIDDQVYHEDKLQEIITERKRQQHLAKEVFEKRKQRLVSNPDKNEYEANKAKIMNIMKNENPTEMGGDIHKKIFGEPEKLPKVEILDDEGNVVSVSQGLTESDEEYKERKERLIREYIQKKQQDEKVAEITDTLEAETEHASKFYNN